MVVNDKNSPVDPEEKEPEEKLPEQKKKAFHELS
jgi:hypothetical protein